MLNIWADLHPLSKGELPCNLGDYNAIQTDADVVAALKEGMKEAQGLLRVLNMAPSIAATRKQWFTTPWEVEKNVVKSFAYIPGAIAQAGEDRDAEVLRVALEQSYKMSKEFEIQILHFPIQIQIFLLPLQR